MSEFQRLPDTYQRILRLLNESGAPLAHRDIVYRLSKYNPKTVGSAVRRLTELALIEKDDNGWSLALDGVRLLRGEPQPTPALVLHNSPPEPEIITAADLEEALSLDDRAMIPDPEPEPAPTLREILAAELEGLRIRTRLADSRNAAWLLESLADHHQSSPHIAAELSRIAEFIRRELVE